MKYSLNRLAFTYPGLLLLSDLLMVHPPLTHKVYNAWESIPRLAIFSDGKTSCTSTFLNRAYITL